jgi:hypothetical protein
MGTLYGTAFSLSLYEITNNQVMTGLLRFAHAILRGVMAVPLDPCLEYGLHHGLDQTIRISPTWFALLCSPWRVPLRVSCSFVWHDDTTCVSTIAYGSQYLSLKTRGTDLNLLVANLQLLWNDGRIKNKRACWMIATCFTDLDKLLQKCKAATTRRQMTM